MVRVSCAIRHEDEDFTFVIQHAYLETHPAPIILWAMANQVHHPRAVHLFPRACR